MKKIIIIGNGIAGVTAAREIRKRSDSQICIISSESKYFFSRTALMYVYMGHMRFQDTQPFEEDFWKKNNIQLIEDRVSSISPEDKSLQLVQGGTTHFDELIIATGSKPNFPEWPGIHLPQVQGMYSKQDLEKLEKHSSEIETAAVIGGGLIGIELVEMLLSRGKKVHFVVREDFFWQGVLPTSNAQFVTKHFQHHHNLTLHLSEELSAINGETKVESILLKSGKLVPVQMVGLTIGVAPNIEFLKESTLEIDRGIVVNNFLQTSHAHIYAIGDCAQLKTPKIGRRPIEAVWYTGRKMGETVAQTICGEPTEYDPGIWFNSAKFFDLEYQTYGNVPSQCPDTDAEFQWEDAAAERLLYFRYDKNSGALTGINTFGIRLRHAVCNFWIERKMTLDEVISDFSKANFDPEFYRSFEKKLLSHFNSTFQKNLHPKKESWWSTLFN